MTTQEVVLRGKPAVALVLAEVAADVRLDCGDGEIRVAPTPFRESGTAWVVDAGGHLITNAHVVQPAYSPPIWIVNALGQKAVESACVPLMLARMGIEPGERPDLEERLKRRAFDVARSTVRVQPDPAIYVLFANGQRLKAEVKKYSPPVAGGEMSGRDLALLEVDRTDLPVLPLSDSASVQIGDPVHILGFPGVVLTHELLNQSAKMEASVTSGSVSGFKEDVANNPVIQTDAPAAWGNSGGPAVNHHAEVLGVLTFVSLAPGPEGSIVQGFNFIIPAAAVRDFVRGTDVQLSGASRFNDEWYAGLEAFFDQRYRRAARHFAAADQIQPGLPDLKRLLEDARSRPVTIPWAGLTAFVTAVSVSLFGVAWYRRWARSRYRIAPAEVARLLERSTEPPLVLDVRAAAAYAKSPLRIPNSIHITPEELETGAAVTKIAPNRTIVAYCT
jgi:hypothetical protein